MQEGDKSKAQSAPVTISVVTPTGGHRVDGKINQTPISFLLDTGAAVTPIREDVWRKINPGEEPKLEPWSEQRLVSVDRSPLDVMGQTKVALHLGKDVFQTMVVVVSPLTTEAILGLDFLKNNRATIDLGAAQLRLGDVNRPLKLDLHGPTPAGCRTQPSQSVRAISSLRLPPYSEQLVMAAVVADDPLNEGLWLLEGQMGGRLPGAASTCPTQARSSPS